MQNWPTERHRKFVGHVFAICKCNGVGLLLKGSYSKGMAHKYSDIDLTIYGNVTKAIIESVIYKFEKPLMVNASENPQGLLIIAYRYGLAFDLEIKLNEMNYKEEKVTILVAPSKYDKIPENQLLAEYLKSITKNDRISKTLKLIHKGLLKLLCEKVDESREFLQEILEYQNIKDNQKSILATYESLVTSFTNKEFELAKEMNWLLRKVKEEKN